MTKYRVIADGMASAGVIVDIHDEGLEPDEIKDLAMETADMPMLCHQCSGWGQAYWLELPEDWDWATAKIQKIEKQEDQ